MQNSQQQYESQWRHRLKRESKEPFYQYERNWVLPSLFKNKEKVLDLASGNSIVGEFLVKNFDCKVSAIDISSSAIKDAKKRGVEGIVGSVDGKLPFDSNSFDMVFWGDNIEHVMYPKKVLLEIKRVLKKDGRLILSTPNQAYWRYRIYPLIHGFLPKTEGEDNPPWEWGHIRFFNRKVLNNLFLESGFTETKFIGVSRRKPDKYILPKLAELFGMIMVVEAGVKK